MGVIGHTGRGNYGHGLDTVWQKLPDTEIEAVADAHVNGLANARKRLQVPQGFADYREMLRKVKLDIWRLPAARRSTSRHGPRRYRIRCARHLYRETFCATPAGSIH